MRRMPETILRNASAHMRIGTPETLRSFTAHWLGNRSPGERGGFRISSVKFSEQLSSDAVQKSGQG